MNEEIQTLISTMERAGWILVSEGFVRSMKVSKPLISGQTRMIVFEDEAFEGRCYEQRFIPIAGMAEVPEGFLLSEEVLELLSRGEEDERSEALEARQSELEKRLARLEEIENRVRTSPFLEQSRKIDKMEEEMSDEGSSFLDRFRVTERCYHLIDSLSDRKSKVLVIDTLTTLLGLDR